MNCVIEWHDWAWLGHRYVLRFTPPGFEAIKLIQAEVQPTRDDDAWDWWVRENPYTGMREHRGSSPSFEGAKAAIKKVLRPWIVIEPFGMLVQNSSYVSAEQRHALFAGNGDIRRIHNVTTDET